MTLTEALSGNDYFSFSVAPQTGKLLTVDTVNLTVISQNQNRSFALFSSVRGFTQDMVIDSFTGGTSPGSQAIVLSGHANQPGRIEFRLYVYGSNNQYESFGLKGSNAFSLSGSIFSITDNQAPTIDRTWWQARVGAGPGPPARPLRCPNHRLPPHPWRKRRLARPGAGPLDTTLVLKL